MIDSPRPGDGASELLELFDAYISARLTAADARRLRSRLLADETARLKYIEYLDLHAELVLTASPAPRFEQEPYENPPSPAARRSRAVVAGGTALGVASAAVLCLVLWSTGAPKPDAPPVSARPASTTMPAVAQVEFDSALVRWAPESLRPASGAALPAGALLAIESGHLELRFNSGARTVLTTSPAAGRGALRIDSPLACNLLLGCAYFSVPESAHGFTVTTSAGEIIDRGTEFGVNVASADVSEVQVFEGLVDVRTTAADQWLRLSSQTAAQLYPHESQPRVAAFDPTVLQRPRAAAAGVSQLSEMMRFHPDAASTYHPDDVAACQFAHLIAERTSVTLSERRTFSAARVERRKAGAGVNGASDFELPAGVVVDSFLVECHGAQADSGVHRGQIRFEQPILAVLALSRDILATTSEFGDSRRAYPNDSGVGLELGGAHFQDRVSISADRRTLEFEVSALKNNIDSFRILTAARPRH